jgi:hypothetical protein
MRNFVYFVFSLVALSALSCQMDEETVAQNTNSFSKSSAISSLIMRVSQYETSVDNILDGTSICSIKLPVQVTINNEYVYVISEADFQTVKDIKEQSNSDDDIVHFGFPITIVYPNYQEFSVNTQQQLNYIFSQYGDDSNCHEINCIDFDYPISINKYNMNNQVASTVTIQSNSQLYNFVNDLDTNEIVGLVYPIMLNKLNGPSITISNNSQLENAIEIAVDECNSNSGPPLMLHDVLASGTWYVSYCYYEYDETNYYSYYDFTFSNNGMVSALKNTTSINGNWSIQNDGLEQRLDLHFDGSQLDKLETSWNAQEITPTYIRLKHENGGGNGSYYLNFTKN